MKKRAPKKPPDPTANQTEPTAYRFTYTDPLATLVNRIKERVADLERTVAITKVAWDKDFAHNSLTAAQIVQLKEYCRIADAQNYELARVLLMIRELQKQPAMSWSVSLAE